MEGTAEQPGTVVDADGGNSGATVPGSALLSAEALADKVDRSYRTVMHWADEKHEDHCPFIKHGRKKMFDFADVAKWMRARGLEAECLPKDAKDDPDPVPPDMPHRTIDGSKHALLDAMYVELSNLINNQKFQGSTITQFEKRMKSINQAAERIERLQRAIREEEIESGKFMLANDARGYVADLSKRFVMDIDALTNDLPKVALRVLQELSVDVDSDRVMRAFTEHFKKAATRVRANRVKDEQRLAAELGAAPAEAA